MHQHFNFNGMSLRFQVIFIQCDFVSVIFEQGHGLGKCGTPGFEFELCIHFSRLDCDFHIPGGYVVPVGKDGWELLVVHIKMLWVESGEAWVLNSLQLLFLLCLTKLPVCAKLLVCLN